MKQELKNVLDAAIKETGVAVKADSAELAAYAAQRAAILATLIGQPGYELAVIAERDNVVLKAGIAAVGQADAAQARLIGVIQGALGISAQIIAGGA